MTTGIAMLAVATIVGAQSYTYNTNLTVGSTGPDVVALQSMLIASGYDIPAVTSGAAAKGYFGSQTKTAVMAYQAAHGIPNTGFFGPLTRASVNAGGAMTGGVTVANCPAGYTCTPTNPMPVVNCPVGFICTPTNGSAPVTGVGLDNADGSVTVTTSSYVSSSQTLKKGDMDKPIVAESIQATVGKVAITRLDVHFSSRPWLLFSGLKLKDASTGQVLATKALSSSNDATEVTVGSDYLVRFTGLNYVIAPGTTQTLVVTADVLDSSDKITGQTITVSTDVSSLRTLNGLGISDSAGVAQTNNLTLSSTGSTGDLNSRISPVTPATQTLNISSTNVTEGVTLGIFDLKLVNQGGTINALNFTVQNNKGYSATTLFQNVQLYEGSTFIGGAYSLASNGTITFTNLNIPMTQDVWKSLTLKADVLATSTAFSASSTVDVSTVTGVDSNYNTITLTNASDRTGNDTTFVPNAGLAIENITPDKGNVITASNSVIWGVAYPSIAFTIRNTGNNPIYISKTPSTALSTSTSAGANASTTVSSVTASGSTTGDTSTSYIINDTRTFTFNFTVDNTNGTTAAKKISITAINYGTSDGSNNSLSVNYGLENAYVQVP